MRSFLNIIFVITALSTSVAQTVSLFRVTDTMLTAAEKNRFEQLKKSKNIFFEDGTYKVTKTCSGEWGGTIKFKDKRTGIEYSCESTCPVSVNKINGAYIVTNSLAHLSGSTEIIRISNPKAMDIFELPPLRKEGKKQFRYVGDDESKSKKGTETLIDSIGVLTLASFVFEKQLFHVVTDFKKTYIAIIENKTFSTVEFICNGRTWTNNNDVVVTDDGHTIISIQGGYIDIFGNQVRLLRAS